MRKRILFLLVFFLFCFSYGCKKKDGPSECAKSYLEEVKHSIADTMSRNSSSGFTEDALSRKLLEIADDFEYQILKESIKGNTAEVTVSIHTYDLKNAMDNATKDLMEEIDRIALAASDPEERFQDLLLGRIEEEIQKGKSYTKEISLFLTKVEKKWIAPSSLSQDLYNAILGDLLVGEKQE